MQKCPNCNKESSKEYYPFCSKRCADVDLGKWLNESYVIATSESPENNDKTDDFEEN